jgi:hypothetical protein
MQDVVYGDEVDVFIAEPVKTDSAVHSHIVPVASKEQDETKKEGKSRKQNSKKEQKKPGVKRTRPKATRNPEEAISKGRKKRRKGDIPVEIYLPTGSYGGGGGPSSIDVGGPEEVGDALQQSKDPTHQLFVKSLRSGSQPQPQEDVVYFEEGAKIIKRARQRSLEELESKKSRMLEQSFVPRSLPDGRKQSIEDLQPICMESEKNSSEEHDPDSLEMVEPHSDAEGVHDLPLEGEIAHMEELSLAQLQTKYIELVGTQEAALAQDESYSEDSLNEEIESESRQSSLKPPSIMSPSETPECFSPTQGPPLSPEHKTGSFMVVAPAKSPTRKPSKKRGKSMKQAGSPQR